ncbi:MAG TPA: hypothetical protein VFB60_20055 [Ktedonobacteraceae bacterium]|nr:hypothetical protein [Ktedonobacteraceae bacterium]
MTNRSMWQVLSWLLAGSLIGLGLLGFDVLFIFIPCFIIGLSLVILGVRRWGSHYLWVAFLSFGIVPELFLLNDIVRAFPSCPPGGLTLPADAPTGTTVSCGGPIPTTYYILLACFGIVALGALAWPILRRCVYR